jgi:hypothetical protein
VWFLSALTTIAALLILWFFFNRKDYDFKEYFRFTKAPVKAIVTAALLGLSWFFLTNGVLSAVQEVLFMLLDKLFAYLEQVAINDLSPVIDMFYECYNVGSGQYALYQSLSQIPNIQYSVHTFQYCGRDTPYGPLELAQIPSSWGGTGA